MPQVPNKMQMPTAITKHSNMTFNESHTTTSNIMELGIANIMEIVPNQSVKVDHRVFTRLEPMPVPTFGDCYIHNRAFFVPMRTIMPEFNSFITDAPVNTETGLPSQVTSTHLLSSSVIRNFLLSSKCSGLGIVPTADNAGSFDFVARDFNGVISYRKFTPYGARCLKIFQSLGYAPDFNAGNVEVYDSALPLLAVSKAYFDWYYPSVYVTDFEASQVSKLFEKKLVFLNGTYISYNLTFDDLENIFNMIERVCYDSDYFTSAWDNPVAPTSLTYSDISITDVTVGVPDLVNNVEGSYSTPLVSLQTAGSDLSQYSLDALKALNDYMVRHRMSGARVLDRYLSRFGKTLDSAILDRSQYLGTHTQDIEFGNVTSTADTGGSTLGSYAGIGIGGGVGSFEYANADEYGYFIILSTIVPKVGYYQGVDRMVMHTSKLDFYTPEFDNLGVQAMATRELFMPLDVRQQYPNATPDSTNFDPNASVFGFVPRYAEYKRGKDRLTGDYRLGSRNAGKDAWYLLRDVAPYFMENGFADTKHSIDFLQSGDADQYKRIFYSNLDTIDYFNVLHLFRIQSSFPGASLYDTYEFEDEDKAQKVSIDVNGVKAN